MSGRRQSPIARVREQTQKGEIRQDDSGRRRASPIARARAQSPKKSPVRSSSPSTDDSMDFPPLSVPFGVECFLSMPEIEKAKKWISTNKSSKFEIYSVMEDDANEYESILLFHWFRPSAGININDIWKVFNEKKGKWYEFLRVVGLMDAKGPVEPDLEFPQMLDPVEEELADAGQEEEEEEPVPAPVSKPAATSSSSSSSSSKPASSSTASSSSSKPAAKK
jgi:hypothetical protein